MKSIFLGLIMTLVVFNLFGQHLDEGKKDLYYQRYHSATTSLQQHLRNNPSDAEGWYWLVRAYTAADQVKQATDSLLQSPASIVNEPYMLLAKAHVQLMENNSQAAMQNFNQAIELTKGKDAKVLGLVAESQVEAGTGDTAYALDVLQRAIKRSKNDPWLHKILGDVYLKMHNGSEAFKAYTAALEKNGKYAEAYYKLGTIFLSQKNSGVYLDHFNKAVQNDNNYAPAYYELYRHYLYNEPARAMEYFRQYAALSDNNLQLEYARADVLYLNKEYTKAIDQAKQLIEKDKKVQGRLYKLIGYSYGELKDTAAAISYMQQYFRNEADSNLISKDFETMAKLFESSPAMQDSAIVYYQIAIDSAKDKLLASGYYKKLAALSKTKGDFAGESNWLGRYYAVNENATNVDLFNWGLASYRAGDYQQADSVFGLYTEKYPTQGFGYYWRARANAAIDTTLKEGLAIPHYQKLIEVLQQDSVKNETNKKWMVQAYSYLAAYETNTQNDYKEAIEYFDKVLELEPENESAKKYIAVLEQNLKKEETQKGESQNN